MVRCTPTAHVHPVMQADSSEQLHSFLLRLDLRGDTPLPYSGEDTHEPQLTLDKYLDLLAKQNYLEKVSYLNGTRS